MCRPNPALYKNGEIIEFKDESYMIFIDKWVQIESKEDYDKRVKSAFKKLESNDLTDLEIKHTLLNAYRHRGIYSQKSNEPIKKAIIEAFGLGSTAKASKILGKGTVKYTPWGIIIGAVHGYSKAYLDIMLKIAKHDLRADSLRKEGHIPVLEPRHYSEFFKF